jgi:hypothetical protein
MIVALIALVVVWIAGIVFAVALCRAAAKRPTFGPPLESTRPKRRATDRA